MDTRVCSSFVCRRRPPPSPQTPPAPFDAVKTISGFRTKKTFGSARRYDSIAVVTPSKIQFYYFSFYTRCIHRRGRWLLIPPCPVKYWNNRVRTIYLFDTVDFLITKIAACSKIRIHVFVRAINAHDASGSIRIQTGAGAGESCARSVRRGQREEGGRGVPARNLKKILNALSILTKKKIKNPIFMSIHIYKNYRPPSAQMEIYWLRHVTLQ